MMKYIYIFFIFLISVSNAPYADCQANPPQDSVKYETEFKAVINSQGPKRITRNIIQDRNGNIWIAAFDGIFRYDGTSFTDITNKVSSARFFSILEDSKDHFWFGSIGSGVYSYDGKSFRNFTTQDGLLNNDVGSIYEDKKGNIWFGVFGGASRYDGKAFHNYIINGDSMNEERTGKTFPERPPYEVTSIIQDKTGKFWLGTRGNTFTYDGKTFTVVNHEDKPFKNVRCIIQDKKGNIWLGGADGLWRYDGSVFTNFTRQFVGHIIEDKKGNIWTSSERSKGKIVTGLVKANSQAWAISWYDGESLSNKNPALTEITYTPMCFGILESREGNIWFGAVDGVYRYDGKTVTSFQSKEGEKRSSDGQNSKSAQDSSYRNPSDSTRSVQSQNPLIGYNEKDINTKYEYTESNGARLIIQNSLPKSTINYTDPNGKKYIYALFWTQIINETSDSLELTIDFPLDSFEIPSASGNYMKLILSSQPFNDYGALKSFLDNNRQKPSSFKRTINPNGSGIFYVVTLSNRGVGGTLRTGLSLKEQDLFYRLNEKDVPCGKINLKNLREQK